MALQNVIPKNKRVNLDLILKEEFHQNSDSGKHDLKFNDLKGDLNNREILCLNNDEILKVQMVKGTFKCEYCDFQCSRPDNLKLHIPIHFQVVIENIKNFGAEDISDEEKMHICEECGVIIVFIKTKTKQNQIKIYKNDSKDSCEKCDNKLIKVGDISKTFKRHIPNKIHTCPYCEKNFSSPEALYCHMEQHNVDQELLYSDSDEENVARYVNDDSGYLENFIINIKQEEQDDKQDIHMSTSSEDNQNSHVNKRKNIMTENDEASITKKYKSSNRNAKFRPYACLKCPFRAVEEKTLEKHTATHFIDKKFACAECSYKGIKSSDLQKHLKTHTGEKPLECSQCQYRTSAKTNLRRHERQHTGEKPFACSECDYKAAQKISLQKHMKSLHS